MEKGERMAWHSYTHSILFDSSQLIKLNCKCQKLLVCLCQGEQNGDSSAYLDL